MKLEVLERNLMKGNLGRTIKYVINGTDDGKKFVRDSLESKSTLYISSEDLPYANVFNIRKLTSKVAIDWICKKYSDVDTVVLNKLNISVSNVVWDMLITLMKLFDNGRIVLFDVAPSHPAIQWMEPIHIFDIIRGIEKLSNEQCARVVGEYIDGEDLNRLARRYNITTNDVLSLVSAENLGIQIMNGNVFDPNDYYVKVNACKYTEVSKVRVYNIRDMVQSGMTFEQISDKTGIQIGILRKLF